MPELSDYETTIFEAFSEAGPTMAGGMGEVPLSWLEVRAYALGSQAISEPWELATVVQMSSAYIEGRAHGETPLAFSPLEQLSNEESTT